MTTISSSKHTNPGPRHGLTAVLDADPALSDALAGHRLAGARAAAIAPLMSLEPGACDLGATLSDQRTPAFGLLVVSGLLVCELRVAGTQGIEFLGPGDLVQRPLSQAAKAPVHRRWQALSRTRLVILDREFATRVRPFPEITTQLLNRACQRSEALAYQLTARQAVRVEDRLLLIVGQLAARWGRQRPEGTVLRIPGLSHEMLARAVGARRSPVTKALGELKRRGLLEIRPGGEIVIPGATSAAPESQPEGS
jgi:CRP-like cAMP-binding protein